MRGSSVGENAGICTIKHMKNKPFVESERGIQAAIINYLGYKGWKTIRLNSGRIPIESNGKKRLVMLSEPGTPDLLAFRKCECCIMKMSVDLLFIEVKRPGNAATALQTAKMKELEAYGAKCITIHSIEELETVLGGDNI